MQGYSPKELLEFIERSPTCFHVVNTLEGILHAGGFEKLQESHRWTLRPGGKYYVTRNGSSIIAFCVPKVIEGFHIMASHSAVSYTHLGEDTKVVFLGPCVAKKEEAEGDERTEGAIDAVIHFGCLLYTSGDR